MDSELSKVTGTTTGNIYLKNIGHLLELSKNGGLIETNHDSNSILFYTGIPESSQLVYLNEDIIIPFSLNTFRILCEMECLRHGEISKWSCKKKDSNSRLFACCSQYGIAEKRKG